MENPDTFNLLVTSVIGFFLGVLSSLLASFITQRNRLNKENKLYKQLAGIWIERINQQPDRKFSIAQFRCDDFSKKFHYNGINFKNSGQIHYRWRTEKIFKDTDTDRILYIYSVSDKNRPGKFREGFGVSYYEYEGEECKFTHGYFLDADHKDEPRDVKFIRADVLAKKVSYDLGNQSESVFSKFIERLSELEERTGKPCF